MLYGGTGFFIDTFEGNGVLALHGFGNVFTKNLAAGETIDVEPGGFLYKDASGTDEYEQYGAEERTIWWLYLHDESVYRARKAGNTVDVLPLAKRRLTRKYIIGLIKPEITSTSISPVARKMIVCFWSTAGE